MPRVARKTRDTHLAHSFLAFGPSDHLLTAPPLRSAHLSTFDDVHNTETNSRSSLLSRLTHHIRVACTQAAQTVLRRQTISVFLENW